VGLRCSQGEADQLGDGIREAPQEVGDGEAEIIDDEVVPIIICVVGGGGA